MSIRMIAAALVALTLLVACGDDDADPAGIQYGTYVRLADPSFESIADCEEQKAQAGDGVLFNCAQRLTLNDNGTFQQILTDIAEAGTFTIEDSTLVLTPTGVGAPAEIPINDDGTVGDGWQLDPDEAAEG